MVDEIGDIVRLPDGRVGTITANLSENRKLVRVPLRKHAIMIDRRKLHRVIEIKDLQVPNRFR